MADFRYDHPHFMAVRMQSVMGAATTNGTNGYWVPSFPVTVTRVSLQVQTIATGVGTGAAYAYTIMYGTATTATAGTFAIGTNVIFYNTSIAPAGGIALAAGVPIWMLKGAEASGIVCITYEYNITRAGSTVQTAP
jgi:hypothetical protein